MSLHKEVKINLSVPCPRHPKENISRVLKEIKGPQQLYCVECLIQAKDPHLFSSVFSIHELIETAAHFYERRKQNQAIHKSGAPPKHLEVFADRPDKLKTLTFHIEEEKQKVIATYDVILADITKSIQELKNKAIAKLDDQLVKFHHWYDIFDKEVKKAYPVPENQATIFPSEEDLVKKAEKMKTAIELESFALSLKADIYSEHLDTDVPLDDKKQAVEIISKVLKDKIENARPTFERTRDDTAVKKSINEFVSEHLKDLFKLKNPIISIREDKDSAFAIPEDFLLVWSWLPEDLDFDPKLIYRASKDGFTEEAFHKAVDGVKNTIVFVKAEFDNKGHDHIIGGYLDEPWNGLDRNITSEKAFLFSTTERVKCPLKDSGHNSYAARGEKHSGPIFGGGYDLAVKLKDPDQSYISPHSYDKVAKMIPVKGYKGEGTIKFKTADLEVYKVY